MFYQHSQNQLYIGFPKKLIEYLANRFGIKSSKDITEEEFTRREFSFNSFKRTFTIPDSVDPTKVDACYSNGVLQLTLPKRKEAFKHLNT